MPRNPRLVVAIAALATLPPAWAQAREPGDPFERFNRRSFAFSIGLDRYIVGPVAKLSTGLIPRPLARVIHNIIVNLTEPQAILNDLLQLRAERAIKATTRLAVNTTVGVLGAVDIAGAAGIRHQPNGFGDTLGHYGVKPGPYLFIPVLGPADFRDLIGAGADQFSSPMVLIDFPYRTPINLSLSLAGGLAERANSGPELDALLGSAADPYATLRSTYLQAREAEIRGETALPPLPDIEGPGEALPSTDTDKSQGAQLPVTPGSVSPAPAPGPRVPPAAPKAGGASAAVPSPATPPSPASP